MQNSLLENRVIRVFISSTFRDMQDERDELMKKTFPMLRRKAAERDVTLTELDLRWGITPEESESGKVVEICLREIENSEPFFIGIIGNRYGWIPSPGELGESLRERYSQVDGYLSRHLSVTEMEMQFGVLERPEEMHAYFFIKAEETEDGDEPEKLAALKAAVRSNGRYPVSTYSSPENLALQVEEAFTKLLEELFPEGALSELEKERIGQRSYLNSLCQNYIRTESNFSVIDEWMEDWEKHQLVITGASGLGKSALVANWVKEKLVAGDNLPYKIIYHFVGNGGSQGSHRRIIKVLCDEIRDRYGFESVASADESADEVLEELFKRVAAEGDKPLLIVLDAVNQIVDIAHSKQLNWLPIPPKKVKILFTTLEDDPTMQVFRNHNYPVFSLQPLTKSQRVEMVKGYLGLYSKKLQPYQIERIVTDEQCENTLVLKTLLDELVNYGVYEKLDEKIESYLGSDSVEDFYDMLLGGYESDFSDGFVRLVLSLIAVSRSGLSEDEILSITKETPLHWSQLFCAIRQHLLVKNGLVSFAHSYIRKAVECRYLKEQKGWAKFCRKAIVALFYKLFYESYSRRAMEEIPYQLDKLDDMKALHDFILDLRVFAFLVQCDDEESADFGGYWRRLTMAGYSLKDYLPRLADESEAYREAAFSHLSDTASRWLGDSGLARHFAEQALSCSHDEEARARSLNALGVLCRGDKSFEYKMQALEIRRKLFGDNHPLVAESYNNVAVAYSAKKEYQKALDCMMKSLEIIRGIYGENHRDVACAYDQIGTIYQDLNDLPKALEFGLKALEIQITLFGEVHLDVANSYNNLGVAYHLAGDSQKSLECLLKALEINRKLLGDRHPKVAESYNNVAEVYSAMEEDQRALDYLMKSLEIVRGIYGENHLEVAYNYCRISESYLYLNDLPNAQEYSLKALEIQRASLGENHQDVADSYDTLGTIYYLEGDYQKSLDCYQKAVEIGLKSLGDHHPKVEAYIKTRDSAWQGVYDLAAECLKKGDYEGALQLLLAIPEVEPSGGNGRKLRSLYYTIGYLYYSLPNIPDAVPDAYIYFAKMLKLYSLLGEEEDDMAKEAHMFMGGLDARSGEFESALHHLEQAYGIAQSIQDHKDDAVLLSGIGMAYSKLDQPDKAEEYFRKAEEARKREENHD